MPSLIFMTVSSLAVAVAVMWHFVDVAVHQSKHVDHLHAHVAPVHVSPFVGDVWALIFSGFP
ncbi:hypothetical protein [Comamonas thiooxydans]|uniref:Uncharacterized protein n=1 Tax=Comamonas thiooxydans TaxID=363952 RepID=A0A0E3CGU7_9BURK|nr:hypothetical protein [Comamonas thiooxydans]KGH12862.1 hypothetical protein P608_09490 [Comamonas thiooxydans]KGH23963.1 hypothetical protein P606_09705 [Comamonas thiooxydans]KGH25591.1 hypothetical protein P607_05080 [Comamonas thiooxydans]MDH1254416.1 hypothetical protein [Comamonas thiooxydans]